MNAANLKKVLLFGLIGAVGCLVGWLVGEVFLLAALPGKTADGGSQGTSLASKPVLPALVQVAQAPPPPPAIKIGPREAPAAPPAAMPVIRVGGGKSTPAPAPPPEFSQRLKATGAKSGDVQISLIWSNFNDLDLHCIEPSGEEIYYAHRISRSQGQLDVDANGGRATTQQPIENIFWPAGKAPLGKYRVYLNYYANQGGRDPSDYKINVLANAERKEFAGQMSRNDPKRLICEFEVRREEPAGLQVAVSPEVVVNPDGKNALKIRVARLNPAEPVIVRFGGDLTGIHINDFTFPANQTDATIEIAALASAAPGVRTVNVQAASAGLTDTAAFKVVVKDLPPELLLSVSPEVSINPGGENRVQALVARSRLPVPIMLSLDGDLGGLLASRETLSPQQNETALTLKADASAVPGTRNVVVVADAGLIKTRTPLKVTINAPRPAIRLAVPAEVRINRDGTNTLPIRIAREQFVGPVKIGFVGNMAGISPNEFMIPADKDEYEATLTSAAAEVGTRDLTVSASSGTLLTTSEMKLVVVAGTAAGPAWSWWLVLVIGLWTALLSLGLSLALVMGQNWYLARPLISARETAIVALGSLAAGVVAGGGGQFLYGVFTYIRLFPEVGFLAGWLLLGGLLGRGVASFIPNLGNVRAALAGAGGGLLGAAAFIGVSSVGDVAGRFAGAAILGFAIGLMVALIEAASRKIWLEIAFGQRAAQTVNLGASPVFIGGNAAKCAIYVPGAPQRALKFWEEDGDVFCLDLVTEKTFSVQSGYRHRLRDALIVVRSGNKPSGPVAPEKPTRPKASTPPPLPPPVPKPKPRPKTTPPSRPPAPPESKTRPASTPKLPQAATPKPSTAECPVCGQMIKTMDEPKRRRCTNCFTMF